MTIYLTAFAQDFYERSRFRLNPRAEKIFVAASLLQIASGYENCQHVNKRLRCLTLLNFFRHRFYMELVSTGAFLIACVPAKLMCTFAGTASAFRQRFG